MSARVYANFVAAGRQQRQIDLLVVTADRCVQVELKNLGPGFALDRPGERALAAGAD